MKDFLLSIYLGAVLASNPTYVGLAVILLLGALYSVRHIRAYFERRANLKFQAEEEAEQQQIKAEEEETNYRGVVAKALDRLREGAKPAWAVQAGVMAIDRGDNETLQKLVNAAHDDIGLVTTLQQQTGKKLGYLLGEF